MPGDHGIISFVLSGFFRGSLGSVPVPSSSGSSPWAAGALEHPGKALAAGFSLCLLHQRELLKLLQGNEVGLSFRGHCLRIYGMGVVETSSFRALGGEKEAGLGS